MEKQSFQHRLSTQGNDPYYHYSRSLEVTGWQLLSSCSKIYNLRDPEWKALRILMTLKPHSGKGKKYWLSASTQYNVRKDDITVNEELKKRHFPETFLQQVLSTLVTRIRTWQCKWITTLFSPACQATQLVCSLCGSASYFHHQVWRRLPSLLWHLGIQTPPHRKGNQFVPTPLLTTLRALTSWELIDGNKFWDGEIPLVKKLVFLMYPCF